MDLSAGLSPEIPYCGFSCQSLQSLSIVKPAHPC
jgi:hypothetical protein